MFMMYVVWCAREGRSNAINFVVIKAVRGPDPDPDHHACSGTPHAEFRRQICRWRSVSASADETVRLGSHLGREVELAGVVIGRPARIENQMMKPEAFRGEGPSQVSSLNCELAVPGDV